MWQKSEHVGTTEIKVWIGNFIIKAWKIIKHILPKTWHGNTPTWYKTANIHQIKYTQVRLFDYCRRDVKINNLVFIDFTCIFKLVQNDSVLFQKHYDSLRLTFSAKGPILHKLLFCENKLGTSARKCFSYLYQQIKNTKPESIVTENSTQFTQSVADLHTKMLDTCWPPGPNYFIFMHFLGTFGKIGGLASPPLGISGSVTDNSRGNQNINVLLLTRLNLFLCFLLVSIPMNRKAVWLIIF